MHEQGSNKRSFTTIPDTIHIASLQLGGLLFFSEPVMALRENKSACHR